MGWGAIIGAVGSLAAAGVESGVAASGGGGSIPKVNLKDVNLEDINAILGRYTGQMQSFPQMRQMAQQLNLAGMQDYTTLLNKVYPGLTTQLGQVSTLANSYLNGQIPSDVQSQIQRATAQQALQGGYSGTGMGGNLTARDLGLTSTSLQQTGLNMLTQGTNLAQGMIPGYINPAQLMFSPTQIQQRQDQLAYYNTQTENQQQLINAGLVEQANAMAQQQANQQASIWGNAISGITKSLGGGVTTSTSGKQLPTLASYLNTNYPLFGSTNTTTTSTDSSTTIPGSGGGSDVGSYSLWPY